MWPPRPGEWVTVPRWLYENTLADDELQGVYVAEARKKVAALRKEVRELSEALADATTRLDAAEGFLSTAEAALERYRRAAGTGATRATVREQPRRAGRRPLLPGP